MLPAAHPRRSIEGEVWGEWNAARFSPTARWKVSETLIFTLQLLQPYFSFLFWASLGFLNSNIPIDPTSKLKLWRRKNQPFLEVQLFQIMKKENTRDGCISGWNSSLQRICFSFWHLICCHLSGSPNCQSLPMSPHGQDCMCRCRSIFRQSASLPFLPPNFACSITFVVQGLQTLMSFVF